MKKGYSNKWEEISHKITKASDIARRVADMRLERARQVCREAGLDPQLLGVHPHNAMCSFEQGRPWKGIDYSKVRLCIRLLNRQFDGNRIVDRYYTRLCEEMRKENDHGKL